MPDSTLAPAAPAAAVPVTPVPVAGPYFSQGAGKAYQSVAQSMAIAVQDAADGLRNTTTMANTAMGVALAQFLSTKDPQYLQAIEPAQQMVTAATTTLATVGSTATTILNSFPAGNS